MADIEAKNCQVVFYSKSKINYFTRQKLTRKSEKILGEILEKSLGKS